MRRGSGDTAESDGLTNRSASRTLRRGRMTLWMSKNRSGSPGKPKNASCEAAGGCVLWHPWYQKVSTSDASQPRFLGWVF